MRTKKVKTAKEIIEEKRSGTDRRKDDRRDTSRDADKGVLSTRKEERRKGGRRKEERENKD